MKKLLLCLFSIVLMLSSISVKAADYITVTQGEEFITDSTETGKDEICKIINMSRQQLDDYYKQNGIIYFAINKTNSKQIRITSSKNKFSESIENISVMSDDEITELIPSIVGKEANKCDIINKNSQKFIKTHENLNDSGGTYNITQYVTIAKNKNYILSFYTSSESDLSYIEKVFKDYDCKDFLNDKNKQDKNVNYAVISVIIVISGIAVVVIYTFVRDLIKLIHSSKSIKTDENVKVEISEEKEKQLK